MDSDTLCSPDFLLCSNEAFDAPLFNKEAFPNGSPVVVHTNEKSPSAGFAFPKCISSSRPQQWLLFPRLGSHVYAFVPHYSASASNDPHLAFKFPDQPGSHALMTRLRLQLNTLCSSYSDKTADLPPSRLGWLLCDTMLFYYIYTGRQGFCFLPWLTQGYTPFLQTYIVLIWWMQHEGNNSIYLFILLMKDFFLFFFFLNQGTIIFRFHAVQGFTSHNTRKESWPG